MNSKMYLLYFYINGPNGLNNKQKNKFFELLETRETSLPKILAAYMKYLGIKDSIVCFKFWYKIVTYTRQ